MDEKTKNVENTSRMETMIGDILGIVNATRLLDQTDAFRYWLVNYHGIQDHKGMLEGYKFTLNVLIRCLLDAIESSSSLKLSEDFVFHRARFVGIPLHKVPNSCSKTILLKNIHTKSQGVIGARTWSKLSEGIEFFDKEVLSLLDNLRSISIVSPHYNISDLDDAITYSSMFNVYIFLNDTQRGVPLGYLVSMLENTTFEPFGPKKKEYLERVFEGYKYAVQFLWYCFLGNTLKKSLAKLHSAADWHDLDSYIDLIQSEIILPSEKKIGTSGLLIGSLIHLTGSADTVLENLLAFNAPKPNLSKKEQLEQEFLWYEIEFIDASEGTVFNGVATFVNLLAGTVVMRKRIGAKEKVYVIKLRHPTSDPNIYHFSYAILMGVSGILSDYSGWLLFYDCCYNTGSGIQGLKWADQWITEYLNENLIELTEIEVDKERFINLMKKRLLSTTKQAIFGVKKTREDLKVANDKLGTSRGLLLELLGYYMASTSASDGKVKKIEWNYNRLDQQIDVLARDQTSLTFIECKKPFSSPLELGKELREKARLLLGDADFNREWEIDERTQIRYMLLTWDKPQQTIIQSLSQQGVEVIILSQELNRHPKFLRKSKDKLRTVFARESTLVGTVEETDKMEIWNEAGGEILEL